MPTRHTLLIAAAVVLLVWPMAAERPAGEMLDLDALYRIKDEGLVRSGVMQIESYLTDVYGPRLTGSPNIKEAAAWAQKTMVDWGLSNVHTENFPFGRGWQTERFIALALEPRAYPLIGFPKAWTPGTSGAVTGEAVLADVRTEADFAKYRGQLRGKFVLVDRTRDLEPHFQPQARRLADSDLADIAKQPMVGRPTQPAASRELERKKAQFWIDEGVIATLEMGRGDGGTLFVQGGGSRDAKDPPVPPQVVLAAEHYGRIARTLDKKIPVRLQFDIENRFYDQDLNAFNILAEIPGTDKAAEVVMLGAHFDSWHSGTGATDNAAGSAVMMEAMRILKTSSLRLRRTVRIALWGGEEQGLLGSRAYVKQHFADPQSMQPTPEHGRLAAYFNVDNGTGAIRGVYLQSNEAAAPIFSAWMEPFKNVGMTTLAIRNTGGTDHLAFDAVGLPGFQFIQDPLEYNTRTHHSNMDVYERVQAQDMMQNAVIVAAFVYHAANRDQMLPRKPLPKPQRPAGQ
jgi:hypothetical protein